MLMPWVMLLIAASVCSRAASSSRVLPANASFCSANEASEIFSSRTRFETATSRNDEQIKAKRVPMAIDVLRSCQTASAAVWETPTATASG
jgi:hypothetical protein